jgi:hypothetical protein
MFDKAVFVRAEAEFLDAVREAAQADQRTVANWIRFVLAKELASRGRMVTATPRRPVKSEQYAEAAAA